MFFEIIQKTQNWKVLLILKNIIRTKTRGFKMLKILKNQNKVMRLWRLWKNWNLRFFICFNLKSPEREDLNKIKELPDTNWSAWNEVSKLEDHCKSQGEKFIAGMRSELRIQEWEIWALKDLGLYPEGDGSLVSPF